MSRANKRKYSKKKKIKKLLLLSLSVFIVILFYSIIVYGEDVFYATKTFIYGNKVSGIEIKVEKNDDMENINLNFVNEGSCDVYLRGFVFVYPKIKEDNGTILSNSAIKIDYGDDDCWFYNEDNYIYYTKPLKVGNTTKKPMVESIEINLSKQDKEMLEKCQLGVDIVMEAVQMNNRAYKYEWNMENTNLEKCFNNKGNEYGKNKDVIKINIK